MNRPRVETLNINRNLSSDSIWHHGWSSTARSYRCSESGFNFEAPVYRTLKKAHEDALTFGLAVPPRRERKRTARTDDVVEQVVRAIRETPITSQRRLSASLGLSKTTIQRILKENKFRPYRLRILHALLPGDAEVRLNMAELMLQRLDDEEDIFRCESIMFTDEANFNTHGGVNTWNTRFYAAENPNFVAEKPLHSSPSVCAFFGFSWDGIVGPWFFEDENLRPTTVNGSRFLDMLENNLLPHLKASERFQVGELFLMMDGAPPHIWRPVLDWLDEHFPNHAISDLRGILWVPRSPDLTPEGEREG